jgi:hypothetical protein
MGLLGAALHVRAEEEGLQPVVWLGLGPNDGMTLRSARGSETLTQDELDRLRTDLETYARDAGAHVDGIDVLQPHGHAWAVSLRVDEPHAFLRRRFRSFFSAVEPWKQQHPLPRYIEVRDAQPQPVLVTAYSGAFGSASTRRDVECCNPLVSFGEPLLAPPPPVCPVFGDRG